MKCYFCGKWFPNSVLLDHLVEEHGLTLAEAEEMLDESASNSS